MRKEYKNPEMKVTEFAAENIVTSSGITGVVQANPDALTGDSSYATGTASLTVLVSFN